VPNPVAVTLKLAASVYVVEKLFRGCAVIANAAPELLDESALLELEELELEELELELELELEELELELELELEELELRGAPTA
jgi:hypothetical protein